MFSISIIHLLQYICLRRSLFTFPCAAFLLWRQCFLFYVLFFVVRMMSVLWYYLVLWVPLLYMSLRSWIVECVSLMISYVTRTQLGARGRVVGWGTMLQAGSSRDRVPMRWSLSIYLSNRNEYRESSWGVKGGRRVKLTTLPPSVSRLSRQNVGASTSHHPMGLHGLLQGWLYLYTLK
jgi:hypothetical protein